MLERDNGLARRYIAGRRSQRSEMKTCLDRAGSGEVGIATTCTSAFYHALRAIIPVGRE